MTDNELLDLYSDYLISAFGQTTATGLATLLDGQISHDRVQRFLASTKRTSSDLWQTVKPHLRAIQHHDGVLILDDSIAEKPYTDENDIICWHYDHTQGRSVKGINFLTALYHAQGVSLPVGVTLIAKTEHYVDKKDGKTKRRSPTGKNEYFREMVQQACTNQLPFRYVLNDVWFASAENMMFIKHTTKKEFVMPLKANRKVALSASDKQQGRYVAALIKARLSGNTLPPFHYKHAGSLAQIGKRKAIIDFGWIKLKGNLAWWIWGIAHIYFLIGLRHRLIVALSWLWVHARDQRPARLITQGSSKVTG
jgi:hypothetical protein